MAWYSVSRSSSPSKNHIPWLIFKQDTNWHLFNLEEGKYYRTQINQLGFANCLSLATCGNWVLVKDNKAAYLYIFNPFTLEIIHLPPLRTHHTSEYKKLDNHSFHIDYYGFRHKQSMRVGQAVLWVDERSKDYLVVWTSWSSDRFSFCRKGYEEWFETPRCESLEDKDEECVILAYNYKDKKLYILSYYGSIMTLDFSQEFSRIDPNNPNYNRRSLSAANRMRMKLTTSGDVLMVRRERQSFENIWFQVYKMNRTKEDWERVKSLDGEEALVSDLSVILPTKGVSRIKKDSIYFCDHDYLSFFMKAGTYEIPTERIEQRSHLVGVNHARWFLPCFGVGEE